MHVNVCYRIRRSDGCELWIDFFFVNPGVIFLFFKIPHARMTSNAGNVGKRFLGEQHAEELRKVQ